MGQVPPKEVIRLLTERHLQDGGTSLFEYVEHRRRNLGISVMECKRVYLDLNFWIYLREASLGESTNRNAAKLLSELQIRADSGDWIFPIEESVFIELFKQKDPSSRQATAELVSRLSRGVSLLPQEDRVRLEVEGLMQSTEGASGQSVISVPEKVWTKTSYILGEMHPEFHGFTPEDNLATQKAVLDFMWDLDFAEMTATFEDSASMDSTRSMNEIAAKIVKESKKHSHKVRSFRQVYLDEYIGLLSLSMKFAREKMEEMYWEASGKRANPEDPQKKESELLNFLGFLIKKSHEAAIAMPTIHVGALCHATLRWDKNRKMKGNDLFDFRHAQAGVAYCNAFFTEKPLARMLLQPNLGISRDFTCKVVSTIEEALEWVQLSDG